MTEKLLTGTLSLNTNNPTHKMTPKEASKDINRGKVYFNIMRKQNKSRTSIKYKKR